MLTANNFLEFLAYFLVCLAAELFGGEIVSRPEASNFRAGLNGRSFNVFNSKFHGNM